MRPWGPWDHAALGEGRREGAERVGKGGGGGEGDRVQTLNPLKLSDRGSHAAWGHGAPWGRKGGGNGDHGAMERRGAGRAEGAGAERADCEVS